MVIILLVLPISPLMMVIILFVLPISLLMMVIILLVLPISPLMMVITSLVFPISPLMIHIFNSHMCIMLFIFVFMVTDNMAGCISGCKSLLLFFV